MASQQKKTTLAWGSRLAPGVKDAVIDLIIDERNHSAPTIQAKLKEQDEEHMLRHSGNRKFLAFPSLSAIERGIRIYRPKDAGEYWKPENEESREDARSILDVHGAMVTRLLDEGKPPNLEALTNQWAEWILCAYKLAPGLKFYCVYLLARLFYIRDLGNLDPKPLDMLLAMAPWRNMEASVKYRQAVEAGHLPPVPQSEPLELEILRDQATLKPIDLNAFAEFTEDSSEESGSQVEVKE